RAYVFQAGQAEPIEVLGISVIDEDEGYVDIDYPPGPEHAKCLLNGLLRRRDVLKNADDEDTVRRFRGDLRHILCVGYDVDPWPRLDVGTYYPGARRGGAEIPRARILGTDIVDDGFGWQQVVRRRPDRELEICRGGLWQVMINTAQEPPNIHHAHRSALWRRR